MPVFYALNGQIKRRGIKSWLSGNEAEYLRCSMLQRKRDLFSTVAPGDYFFNAMLLALYQDKALKTPAFSGFKPQFQLISGTVALA
ncbi:hypothetical protein [Pantoea sp. ICBG 1758]|uniref:hypothetical protein n=1 Tax=Pantoea sp. ICBG 1758 TaxID=2071682 RepID=UPI0011B0EE25|nr:hypothetical protein [Pantoea sp. ICBG 1758]